MITIEAIRYTPNLNRPYEGRRKAGTTLKLTETQFQMCAEAATALRFPFTWVRPVHPQHLT